MMSDSLDIIGPIKTSALKYRYAMFQSGEILLNLISEFIAFKKATGLPDLSSDAYTAIM